MKRYTLENKPTFHDGEEVEVDMEVLGSLFPKILKGRVVGKSTEHIIDIWLVEFDQTFELYPYRVVAVPHIAIIEKKEKPLGFCGGVV
jgi:hypothetical protein